MNLETEFIGLLEERLTRYKFDKAEAVLSGRVHTVDFVFNSNNIDYHFFIRLLPKASEFEIYLKVEYKTLSAIIKELGASQKFRYTFTEKLADFLEPKNADWFIHTTSLDNEETNLKTMQEVRELVDYIERKYIKAVIEKIIPRTDSLEKLNALLNNFDDVYDIENDEPKMYVLSGGMVFQSIAALLLNTLFKNDKKDKLIKMYSWLYNVIKDEDDIDKMMLKNVIAYVNSKGNECE